MILAGEDAVDAYLWWVSPSLPGLHAETGLSQVQILPARPNIYPAKLELRRTLSGMVRMLFISDSAYFRQSWQAASSAASEAGIAVQNALKKLF